MARSRAVEQQRSRPKTTPLEEITLGIAKFQEVVAAINDISQEGFPYRDAAQSKAELQFRECLRQTFGERSQEFQTHRNFKIRTADKADVTRCLAIIKGLIHTLEDRKLELQGLTPLPQTEPRPEATLNNTARMVLVPPTTPTVTAQTTPPMTFATAIRKEAEPSSAPATPIPQAQPADPSPFIPTPIPNPTANVGPGTAPSQTPTPVPTPTPTTMPTAPVASPVVIPTPSPVPTPAPPPVVQPALSMSDTPVEAAPAQPEPVPAPAVSAMPAQSSVDAPAPAVPSPPTRSEAHFTPASTTHNPSSDRCSTGSTPQSMETELDQDPLQLVRKVCLRLHSVARQLRLRRDYRPTLEIEDDHDLQDLLCALLKVEFDEVAIEDWIPPYTEGRPRTMLLINRDQIAVVATKTRSGLSAKELADQVTADSAYYRAQGRGSTLFCFMYDPEGRIGSPKRLETTLTSVSEHCRVEVLVAPK